MYPVSSQRGRGNPSEILSSRLGRPNQTCARVRNKHSQPGPASVTELWKSLLQQLPLLLPSSTESQSSPLPQQGEDFTWKLFFSPLLWLSTSRAL